jgi:dTDP-4-dehydrorhamnose reductase
MGQHFLSLYRDAANPPTDIADAKAVQGALDGHKPDVVINCAGKTGRPNVDWCEDHPTETFRSNVLGPLVLLEECRKRGIYWVHLSTGCIYEESKRSKGVKGRKGDMGFSEEDPPNFFGSVYARTKGLSDQLLKGQLILQLRPRMPFSGTPHDRNLITKLLSYPRVLDVQNSLTSIEDFLSATAELVRRRRTGTYNIVNPGTLSPFDVMQMYKEIVDPMHTFERLTLEDLPTAVKAGRSNCILSTEKLAREGIALRPVGEAMRVALKEYKRHVQAGRPVEV